MSDPLVTIPTTSTDAPTHAAAASEDASAPATAAAPAPVPVDDRAVLSQLADIRAEVESTQELVSEPQPTLSLLDVYADNAAFLPKIRALASTYPHIRCNRGDGNCFYRSFLISLGAAFVRSGVVAPGSGASSSPMQALYESLLIRLEASCAELIALGYPDITMPDFHEAMLDYVRSWSQPGASEEGTVCGPLRDRSQGMYIITYLRCLCSLEMLTHEEEYFPYVLGIAPHCATVRMFCEVEVEAVSTDADQLQVMAAARWWRVGITIGYIDASPGEQLSMIVFPTDDGVTEETHPRLVHLLYRPGHYDVADTR